MTALGTLLLQRAEDDRPALLWEDRRWSYRDRAGFDPATFDAFLRSQPDLGPKWVPAFVRVDAELPKLSSMKLDKKVLRRDAWQVDGVVWRPSRHDSLRTLTEEDRRVLAPLVASPSPEPRQDRS